MGLGSWFQDLRRNVGLRSPYMPGEDEAKQQYQWDRNAMQDSMDANRHSQTTPWGSIQWDGDNQITSLNPGDQQRLDQWRQWQSGIGGQLPGLTNAIAQMGTQQFNLPQVRRPGKGNIPDPSQYQDLDRSNLPGFHNLDFQQLDFSNLPGVNAGVQRSDFRGVNPTQFTQLDLRGMPGVSQSQFQNLDLGGLQGVNLGSFQNLDLGGLQGVNAAGADAGNVVDRSGMADKRSGQLAALQQAIAGMPRLSGADDFGAESERISQSVYDRAANLLSPQLERQRDSRENDLWQRGLQGTEAGYSDLDRLDEARERQFNDLALASVLAGSNEHQRLADLTSRNRGQLMGEQFGLFDAGGAELSDIEMLNRGGSQDVMDAFSRELGLRGQQFNERMGSAQIANQNARDQFGQQLGLRGQQFNERLAGTNIANQNANNIFGQQMGLRGQAFNERMAGTDIANQIARDRFGQDVTGANIHNQNIQNLFGNQFAMRGQGANEQMAMNQVANDIQQLLGTDAMNRRGQMFGEEQAANNVFNQNRNNQFNQLMNRENMRWGQNMDRYNIATEQRRDRLAEQQAQDARAMQAYGMLTSSFMPPGMPTFQQNPTYGLAAPDLMGMLGDRAAMQGQQGQGILGLLGGMFGPQLGKWIGGKFAGGEDT